MAKLLGEETSLTQDESAIEFLKAGEDSKSRADRLKIILDGPPFFQDAFSLETLEMVALVYFPFDRKPRGFDNILGGTNDRKRFGIEEEEFMGVESNMGLKESILLWIDRLLISVPNCSFDESFRAALHFWITTKDIWDYLSERLKVIKDLASKEVGHQHDTIRKYSAMLKTLHWICKAHIQHTAFGLGFEGSSRSLLSCLQMIGEESSVLNSVELELVGESPSSSNPTEFGSNFLVDALVDTVEDAAQSKTLTSLDALHILLSGIQAAAAAESSFPSSAQHKNYIFLFQIACTKLVNTTAGKMGRRGFPSVELVHFIPNFWVEVASFTSDNLYDKILFDPTPSRDLESIYCRHRRDFDSTMKRVRSWYKELASACIHGQISVQNLKKVRDCHDLLQPAWTAVRSRFAHLSVVNGLVREVEDLYAEATALRDTMSSLMGECDELHTVSQLLTSWIYLHVDSIKRMLIPRSDGLAEPFPVQADDGDGISSGLQRNTMVTPLPSILLRSLDWLSNMKDSQFFSLFWKESYVVGTPDCIAPVLEKLLNLHGNILDVSLPLAVLDKYGDVLLKPTDASIGSGNTRTEAALFVQAVECIQKQSDGQFFFESFLSMREREPITEAVVLQAVARWSHVRSLYMKHSDLLRMLSVARSVVAYEEHQQMSVVETTLLSLHQLIDSNGRWESQLLSSVNQEYWVLAKAIPGSLLKVEADLLIAITQYTELLNWLRTIKDDELFKTSIEIARSLPETTAPRDLWDKASGRVNERYLSTVGNVRSYLYKYLYTSNHPCESWADFVIIFSTLNSLIDSQKIVQDMRSLSQGNILAALKLIIGVSDDITGSSRLLKLYDPDSAAKWVCAKSSSSSAGTTRADLGIISLEYQIANSDEESTFSCCKFTYSDLSDFQGTIVLEKSLVPSKASSPRIAAERDHVEEFLTQYSLMRRLADASTALHDSGHFDYYPKYRLELPLCSPVEAFRVKVEQLEQAGQQWRAHVRSVRESHYFINYFDLKRCFEILRLLDLDSRKQQSQINASDIQSVAFESLRTCLQGFISFVNLDYAFHDSNMLDFTKRIIATWNATVEKFEPSASPAADSASSASLSNNDLLSCLGEVLDATCVSLPRRRREVHVAQMDVHIVVAPLGKGIHVALGQSPPGLAPRGQYDQLLTLCAVNEVLPEYETCLCCSNQTTVEHVSLLLYRWHSAHQHGRAGTMYALVEADKLQYDVQNAALRLLRDLGTPTSLSSGPLVLIAESDQCHFVSQFMYNRVSNGVLPLEKLSEVCAGLSVACHTSKRAGGGKSFSIRLKTKQSMQRVATPGRGDLLYAHIPINATTTKHTSLIPRIHEAVRRACVTAGNSVSGTLLHLDAASTCGESLLGTVFSIMICGVVADFDSIANFSIDPQRTLVCLELATGLQYKCFSHCLAYCHQSNSASPATCCLSHDELLRGMGPELFYSAYSDVQQPQQQQQQQKQQKHYDYALGGSDGGCDSDSLSSSSSIDSRPVNAFERLYYVTTALECLRRFDGAFPTTFDISHFPDTNMTEAFDLLNTACGGNDFDEGDEDTWRPSYWCLWSFINIVHMQLQAFQDHNSPISLACVPDTAIQIMSPEFDVSMKQRVKGEMVKFIVRTAKEFVTRLSTGGENSDRIAGVFLWNCSIIPQSKSAQAGLYDFSPEMINKFFWKRESYDNDGQPVFKSPTFVTKSVIKTRPGTERKYYLYYRESENRWVIDDTVTYTGAVFVYSLDGTKDLENIRFERRNCDTNQRVKVRVTLTRLGQNMKVEGFSSCPRGRGVSMSTVDDGIYEPADALFSYDAVTQRYFLPHTKLLRDGVNGTRVEALFKPRNAYAPAKVTNVRPDGRYDVTFDDPMYNEGDWRLGLQDYQIHLPNAPVLHYFKPQSPQSRYGPDARHLFYEEISDFNRNWVISSTCNCSVSGVSAYSDFGETIPPGTRDWSYLPTNSAEDVTIRYVRTRDNLALFSAATGGAVDSAAAELERMGMGVENLARWSDSNHESFLFNKRTGLVSFLSLNSAALRQNMHPVLLRHLETNHVPVGQDLSVLSNLHWEILSGLTGIARTEQDAIQMMGQSFCLTGDSLLKILAIVHRAHCKIPVVLMGECGCGKTMLLSFLCRWLGVRLISLDVHGGTTERDIIETFSRASSLLDTAGLGIGTVFVFLDEVNTCDHMGLISEAICHRTLYGRRLKDGIQILAALNPYRYRPKRPDMGLVSSAASSNPTEKDGMAMLVYRVKPIPSTLKEFIFDFGSLDSATELLYIQSMIRGDPEMRRIFESNISLSSIAAGSFAVFVGEKEGKFICKLDGRTFPTREVAIDHLVQVHHAALRLRELDVLGIIINRSQEFVRVEEGDPSVVSLRDVKRTLLLLRWFHDELRDNHSAGSEINTVARAATLAIAHVYWYRLASDARRRSFWQAVAEASTNPSAAFNSLSNSSILNSIVSRAHTLFVDNLEIEDGISMNSALTENVFVSIVCMLNKVPIFIVGKPGTSKTLALQVIENNLQGQQSPRLYWRKFPAVHIFQYQCSPMSTTQSIKYQFEAAKAFQEHSSGVLTVLLLDEVGLAENSPDMPLKVLHYMLVDPPIAIVGISNWTLDSSKMNRAILLQRPEPSEDDLFLTGQSIVATSGSGTSRTPRSPTRSGSQKWLGPLARAFRQIYTEQRSILGLSRDFFGMRDYYGMAKFLRAEIEGELTFELLASAVGRNFGGVPRAAITAVASVFFDACTQYIVSAASRPQSPLAYVISLGRTQSDSSGAPMPSTSTSSSDQIVPVVNLIAANLGSRTSRNLMVLSENDTVMQLLFGCGILDETKVSVLVGSRFQDDLEELYLIQQINKVKVAMAEGKVAVLLNNDSIYESLYDVLNQRYVRQKDPETGIERRLLRLAIGSRSQLCAVHPDFKIIVVVKQSHAYENLDLPLLNRFEKQSLSPVDVLDPTSAAVELELEKWCEQIKSEAKIDSMSKIFCGFYEGTISSLLLSLTDFGKRQIASKSELKLAAQQKLLKLVTPVGFHFSKTLKTMVCNSFSLPGESGDDAVNRIYSERVDLLTALRNELRQPLSLSPHSLGDSRLLVVATRSPTDHFELCICRMKTSCNATSASGSCAFEPSADHLRDMIQNDLVSVSLGTISSERVFSKMVEDFYSGTYQSPVADRVATSASRARLMIVLCDPLYCDLSTISHAQYIVTRAHCIHAASGPTSASSGQSSAAGGGGGVQGIAVRHVVFIVHLPPGIMNRERQFSVDMYAPWSYTFVDELIAAEDVDGPELLQLLTTSVSDLCESGYIPLPEFLHKNFQRALVQCTVSPLVDEENPRGKISRVKMMKELLEERNFRDFLTLCISSCLRSIAPELNGMHLHIVLANEIDMGSYRRSLYAAVEIIIISAFAYILRLLDENYNLSWLYEKITAAKSHRSAADSITNMWIELAHKVLNLEDKFTNFTSTCTLLKKQNKALIKISDRVVLNTGSHGTFACLFPFSEKLIAFVCGSGTLRNQIESVSTELNSMRQTLDALLTSSLQTSFAQSLYSFVLRETPDAYLHDFIATRVHPIENVDFATQFRIIRSIVCASDPDQARSSLPFTPAAVHVSYWAMETIIFRALSACSIMRAAVSTGLRQFFSTGGSFLPPDFDRQLTDRLDSLVHGPHLIPTEPIAAAIYTFFMRVLSVAIESACSARKINPALIRFWLDLWSSMLPDLDSFFALVATGSEKVVLQRQKWGLMAWSVVLREYLALNTSQPLSDSALLNLLGSVKNADPSSATCLGRFMEASARARTQGQILQQRYLKKFVMPELLQLYKSGNAIERPSELIWQIGTLLMTTQRKFESYAMEERICMEREALFLLRAAIDLLYSLAKVPDLTELVSHWIASTFSCGSKESLDILQLLLERMEDDDDHEDSFTHQILGFTVDDITDDDASSDSFPLLQQLGQARTPQQIGAVVASAGLQLLSEIVVAKQKLRRSVDMVSRLLDSTASLPPVFSLAVLDFQVLFLSHLLHKTGKLGLVKYLRRRDDILCLPPEVARIDPRTPVVKSFDPFSSLGGRAPYFEGCTAISQACYSKSPTHLDAWSQAAFNSRKSHVEKVCILLAGLATQVYCNDFPVDPQAAFGIVEWIKKGFSVTDSVVGKLATDVARLLLAPKSGAGVISHLDPMGLYLLIHTCVIALQNPTSWMFSLLYDPASLKKMLLPSMVDSELAQMLLSSSADQDVGVYECPKGHVYTIGNCTRPWVTSRCPVEGCGSTIGGQNHSSATGNRQLGTARELAGSLTNPGYILSATSSVAGYEIPRLGKLTTAVLRYLIHNLMLLSAELYPVEGSRCSNGGKSGVVEIMYPDASRSSGYVSSDRVIRELKHNLDQDWCTMLSVVQMDFEDVAMGVHMILIRLRGRPGYICGVDSPSRLKYEQALEREIIEPTFTSRTSKEVIRAEKRQYESDNIDKQLHDSLQAHHAQVFELSLPADLARAARIQLWRYRESVTFDRFSSSFSLLGRKRSLYPVITAVLKLEPKLSVIKYVADVFAWQALLFKYLKPGNVTRDEAVGISHAAFIQIFVPPEEREQAHQVMQKFCAAFNATIHMFPGVPLCECADNIFAPEGRSAVHMHPGESVAFALPNRSKRRVEMMGKGGRWITADEFMEPRNLCSVFILEQLQQVQDQVVTALLVKSSARSHENDDDAIDPALGRRVDEVATEAVAEVAVAAEGAAGEGVAGEGAAAAAGGGEGDNSSNTMHAPLFSFLTPYTLVKRQLLEYDRVNTLMPFVLSYADQPVEFGHGELTGFDFARIESDLRDQLLPSAQPFALALRDFSFKGETKEKSIEATMLAMLGLRVAQTNLPDILLDRIWQEVDTEPRRIGLSAQIEDCIVFISAAGGAAWKLDGDMKLATFVLETLLVDTAVWRSMSGATLASSVCLKHLKSLHRGIRRRESGGLPFPGLDLADYGQALDEGLEKELRRCARAAPDLAALVDSLEDFIWFKLCQQPLRSFSGAELDLQENLNYVQESMDWFDSSFPYVRVDQVYETFKVLRQMC